MQVALSLQTGRAPRAHAVPAPISCCVQAQFMGLPCLLGSSEDSVEYAEGVRDSDSYRGRLELSTSFPWALAQAPKSTPSRARFSQAEQYS